MSQETSPLPSFLGLDLLPPRAPMTDDQQGLYQELWNKIAWAMGSSFKCPYRGGTQIRSLARRLVLVVIANQDSIQTK